MLPSLIFHGKCTLIFLYFSRNGFHLFCTGTALRDGKPEPDLPNYNELSYQRMMLNNLNKAIEKGEGSMRGNSRGTQEFWNTEIRDRDRDI